jgi:formylglycine-generating enzyme required for sulfatase activity
MKHKNFYLVLAILLMGLLSGVIIAQEGDEEIEPVTANEDWEPVIQDFDGVEMVLVPPGCFMMGSTEEQIDAVLEAYEETYCDGECPDDRRWIFESESPQHEICFDKPFWIDRYEVSNAQFAAFGGVAAKASNWAGGRLPREQITWFEAVDFCELRGARLPNEAEWEYATRGPDGLLYSWGSEVDGTLTNLCDVDCSRSRADKTVDDGYQYTAPVGSYEDGISWVGAFDMSGNVWEWTSTVYAVDPERDRDFTGDDDILFSYPYDPLDGREEYSVSETYIRILRGGSWFDNGYFMRATFRAKIFPDYWSYDHGIRCARSFSPGS